MLLCCSAIWGIQLRITESDMPEGEEGEMTECPMEEDVELEHHDDEDDYDEEDRGFIAYFSE
jgi:hypothetical protein